MNEHPGRYEMGDYPSIAECVAFCEENDNWDTIDDLIERCIKMARDKRLIDAGAAADIAGCRRSQIGSLARAGKLYARKKPVLKSGVHHWEWHVDSRDVEKYARLDFSQRRMYGKGKIDLDGEVIE